MLILMKAEVFGQTQTGYKAVFDSLAPLYQAAPGFVAHFSHPMEGGWCVIDIWTSKDEFQDFFSRHVVHRLEANLRPKISFQVLHDGLLSANHELLGSDA
jgi:heme-degrading monooxygenase HmoA